MFRLGLRVSRRKAKVPTYREGHNEEYELHKKQMI